MSRWTHVAGSIKICGSAYSAKKKKLCLANPSVQCILSKPMKRKEDGKIVYDIYALSLPRVRPIVESLLKKFPQGECGLDARMTQSLEDASSSSNCFNCKDDEAEWKDLVKADLRNNDFSKMGFSKDEGRPTLEDAALGWAYDVDSVQLTIDDDIRYCSGIELLDAFTDFVQEAMSNDSFGILLTDGCFKWEDEYEPNIVFLMLSSGMDGASFMILDKKTGACKCKKSMQMKLLKGMKHEVNSEESRSWLAVTDSLRSSTEC